MRQLPIQFPDSTKGLSTMPSPHLTYNCYTTALLCYEIGFSATDYPTTCFACHLTLVGTRAQGGDRSSVWKTDKRESQKSHFSVLLPSLFSFLHSIYHSAIFLVLPGFLAAPTILSAPLCTLSSFVPFSSLSTT